MAVAAMGHARPGGWMANANVVDAGLIALYEEAAAAVAEAEQLGMARELVRLQRWRERVG